MHCIAVSHVKFTNKNIVRNHRPQLIDHKLFATFHSAFTPRKATHEVRTNSGLVGYLQSANLPGMEMFPLKQIGQHQIWSKTWYPLTCTQSTSMFNLYTDGNLRSLRFCLISYRVFLLRVPLFHGRNVSFEFVLSLTVFCMPDRSDGSRASSAEALEGLERTHREVLNFISAFWRKKWKQMHTLEPNEITFLTYFRVHKFWKGILRF